MKTGNAKRKGVRTRGSTADWSDIIILSGCDPCGGENKKPRREMKR